MERPKFLNLIGTAEDAAVSPDAQVRARAQTMQRLQVGVIGICVLLLAIALAATLTQRAQDVEETAVPDAAPTTEPEAEEPQADPLADAGVLPDIPDEEEVEVEADGAEADVGVAPETAGETEVEDTEAQ